MWLIIGLGNPGRKYTNTRHNLGFVVLDALSKKFSIPIKYSTRYYKYGRGVISNHEVLLIKPLTFMNNSGIAIKEAVNKYRDMESILIIHDDLDLETGRLKIKKKGSSGGHRGIESIIERLNTGDFLRLKIGIGRPCLCQGRQADKISPEEYVLSNFNKQEKAIIKEAVTRAVDAVAMILEKGVSQAQNSFH
jgi:PTH1 family peptidyl-tRNA hydrolase